MATTIEATQADIDGGKCGDATACMLASAINRKLKPGFTASVCPSRDTSPGGFVLWDDDDCREVYYGDLPNSANEEALSFDQDKALASPVTFDLDIPEEYLK